MSGHDAGQAGHPPALKILFLTEMWERFGFFAIRVLLVLYLTKHYDFGDREAYGILGAYTALVFTGPVLGGRLADTLLGYRYAIILGASLMAFGEVLMVIAHLDALFVGMGFVIVGNGFVKSSTSSLLGLAYPAGDARRDSGFTIFYIGINVGAAVAAVACAWVGETYGYPMGFALASAGMLAGLAIFVRHRHVFGRAGDPPDPARLRARVVAGLSRFHLTIAGCLSAALALALLVQRKPWVDVLLGLVGAVVVVALVLVALRSDSRTGRDRLVVLLILMGFNVAFWACFEQAGSSLTLFAERNTDRDLAGFEFPAASLQAVNPILIVALGALFSALWIRLGRVGRNPSIPAKFALALILLAAGYGVLVAGIRSAGATALVPLGFIIALYVLHTMGELCLSPIGLSTVTKIAPPKMVGLVMGAWFLSSAAANSVAASIASLTGDAGTTAELGAHESLAIYGDVFTNVAWVAGGLGALLLLLSGPLRRRLHGLE